MNEGISTPSGGEVAGGEAGGLPPQVVPTVKKFFLIEYLEEVRRGFTWMRTAPKAEQNIVNKVTVGLKKWSKLRKARVGMVVVVVIILAASGLFAGQAGSVSLAPGHRPVGPGATGKSANFTIPGNVTENGNTSVTQAFETTHFSTLRMTLTWTDEPAGTLRTNRPDQLCFSVKAPNGANWTAPMKENAPGGQGQVAWTLDDTTKDYGAGPWTINVVGGTMGDVVKTSGNPVCFTGCHPDTGNSWSLKIEAAW